ncbi:MAG: CBS domain-containing protein [Candidatus Omnitrophica bacterium]|nr:CBS domain-containing protein [Candidatus Omnitrophota bacterium]
MKVKEIMTREVTSLSPELTVQEALGLLAKMEISGLPVIDLNGKLVGMFTEKEALEYILPSYISKVGRFIYEENPKSIKNKFSEMNKMKVSELMRKDVITTLEETTLCEVARIMLTQRSRRLPVLDKTGSVVGIVARSDILAALASEAETAK